MSMIARLCWWWYHTMASNDVYNYYYAYDCCCSDCNVDSNLGLETSIPLWYTNSPSTWMQWKSPTSGKKTVWLRLWHYLPIVVAVPVHYYADYSYSYYYHSYCFCHYYPIERVCSLDNYVVDVPHS